MAVLLVGLASTPVGRRALVPGPSGAELALDRQLDEVRFDAVPLDQALRSIAQQAGVEISVDWDEPEDDPQPKPPVTLWLRNVAVRQAILATLEAWGHRSWLEIERLTAAKIRLSHSGGDAVSTLRLYDIRQFLKEDAAAMDRLARLCPNLSTQPPSQATIPIDLPYRYHGIDDYVSAMEMDVERRNSNDGPQRFARSGLVAMEHSSQAHRKWRILLERLAKPIQMSGGMVNPIAAQLPQKDAAFNQRIKDLNLVDVTLEEAVTRLQQAAFINVVVSPDEEEQQHFSLHVQDVTAISALDMILAAASNERSHPLFFEREGNVGIVTSISNFINLASSHDYIERPPRVYDISDLIIAIAQDAETAPEAGAPQLTVTQAWDNATDAILNLIREEAVPEPEIVAVGGRLLVRGTSRNQLHVAQFLNMLHDGFVASRLPDIEPDSPKLISRLKIIGGDTDSSPNAAAYTMFLMNLTLDGVTIMEAIRQIGDELEIKIGYSAREIAAADIDLNKRIHLHTGGIRVEEALRVAFDAVSDPGTVSIKADESHFHVTVTSSAGSSFGMYDVRDLLKEQSPFRTRCQAEGAATKSAAIELLKTYLTKSIDEASWGREEAWLGTYRYLGGRLFIAQTPKNHKAAARLLEELRTKRTGRLISDDDVSAQTQPSDGTTAEEK